MADAQILSNDLQLRSGEIAELIDAVADSCGLTLALYDATGTLLAAAGPNRPRVAAQQGAASPVATVIANGLNLVIDKERGATACEGCPLAAGCELSAELLTPLVADGRCQGVLAAMAWGPDGRDALLGRRAIFLQLLRHLGAGILLRDSQTKSAARLQGLKAYLQYALDANHESALVVSNEHRIVTASAAAAGLLRTEPEQLRSRQVGEVLPGPVVEAVRRGRPFQKLEHEGLRWEGRPIQDGEARRGMALFVGTVAAGGPQRSLPDRGFGLDDIRGCGEALARVKAKARRVAPTESTVLIRGESGTGKELFARAIHWESNRRNRPFVALNCAAIPESLLESELFGYEDGAFTGARKGGKPGKVELANGGTLLLDEVGDIPMYLQAKLLRVLQFKEVERVGGARPAAVDFRLIAATNRPLEAMMKEGTFREDLYYRLNVIPIDLPPLRDRKEDLPLLMEFFTKKLAYVGGHRPKRWSAEALNALHAYHWPGNIREFENVVEYAVSVEEADMITVGSLPERLRTALNLSVPEPPALPARSAEVGAALPAGQATTAAVQATTAAVQAPAAAVQAPAAAVQAPAAAVQAPAAAPSTPPAAVELLAVLDRFGRTTEAKEQAAECLGISRATLYRRLKALGIR